MRRLGSVREQQVSVRIVAATHQPLEALVQQGRFRADLYYRLCVVQLHLPALRERGADILLLARHFISLHAARYGKATPPLTQEAEAAMLVHPWPGNVRELRNVLEQAALLNTQATIDAAQLGLAAAPAQAASLPEIERKALLNALQNNGWNVSRAARALGITRDTLRYRMDKHGLESVAVHGFAGSQR
jgi:two-component system response regulator AtoC